jgi:two-component system sensor histidine kinase PilS (NtrC family)
MNVLSSRSTRLITTDLDGKIYALIAMRIITGQVAGNIVGRNIREVFGDDVTDKVDICLGAVRSTDFTAEHFEAQLDGRDRKLVTAVCSISPLFRRTGEVSGLIVTFQDISQVRALESSLRQADRLAAVGRLAAGLAHEIRNPLGSLSSSLQFLRGRVPADSSEASLFDVVLRESERLNGIITNFLSYARPPVDAPTGNKSETISTPRSAIACAAEARPQSQRIASFE